MNDWLGSGEISTRETAERIIAEAMRRIKLEARNDPNFVPTASDQQSTLSARRFVVPVLIPERPSSDANDIMAGRAFARFDPGAQGTPVNIPGTIVQRGAAGEFAAGQVQVVAIQGTTVGAYDLIVYAPNGTTVILRIPTGTLNIEMLGQLKTADKFTVTANGYDVTGNSKVTGNLDVTGTITGTYSGNAATATALAHATLNVTGTGSSPALHNLMTALATVGVPLSDSTTP